MSKMLANTIPIVAIFLSGCATNLTYAKKQGVFPVTSDTYEVFREDHRGIFGSAESIQREVIEEANDFANKKSMLVVPLEAKQHRVGTLGDWAWGYYKFKLVPTGESAAVSTTKVQFMADARMSNDFLDTKDVPTARSSYDELLKLDDLRKKGVLTEDEFQAQKKRLLE